MALKRSPLNCCCDGPCRLVAAIGCSRYRVDEKTLSAFLKEKKKSGTTGNSFIEVLRLFKLKA